MSEHEREVGGLHCSEVLARLSDYLDGDLDAEARSAVERHLAGCSVCERFGGHFADMVRSVRRQAARDEPAEDRLQDELARRLGEG